MVLSNCECLYFPWEHLIIEIGQSSLSIVGRFYSMVWPKGTAFSQMVESVHCAILKSIDERPLESSLESKQ